MLNKKSSIVDIINSKQNIFCGRGASVDEIKELSNKAKVVFSDEYIEYLKVYGIIAFDGHELTGLSKTKRLNVSEVTLEYKRLYRNELDLLYVVEVADIDGILIWQSEDGKIYKTIGDSNPILIYESLSEYINAL